MICMDILFSSDSKSLLCGHSFHLFCINQWLKIKQNCPICRTSTKRTRDIKDITYESYI